MLDHLDARLEHDPWLSRLLGKDAYHLKEYDAARRGFDSESLSVEPKFVDAKVPTDRIEDVAALEALGFRLIDTNVQLARPKAPVAGNSLARFAEPGDQAAVAALAGTAFRWDRFHLDPAIPNATANAIKAEWAANFFRGKRGDWMVVAESDGVVAGFLQLVKGRDGRLVIDLIAVDEEFRRLSFACSMIAFAAARCMPEAGMLVGTQISNVESLRLYEALDFRVVAAWYVLHYHGT